MTSNFNQNLDIGSLIDEKIDKIEQNSDIFLEKEQKTANNNGETCKNEDNFDDNLCKNVNIPQSKQDPVSEIDSHLDCKNETNNFLQISENDDTMLFSRLFPGLKRENIEKDRLFKLFARGRRKEDAFTAVYSDFVTFVNELSEDLRVKHIYDNINKTSEVGALSASEPYDDGFFTKEQVLKMSKEQIAENYEKIRKSQPRW